MDQTRTQISNLSEKELPLCVKNVNFVLLDICRHIEKKPLFRLKYVHSISKWKLDNIYVEKLNQTCSAYSTLQHIKFLNIETKTQILLVVDATQFILEKDFFQGPNRSTFAIRNMFGWTITGPMKRITEEFCHAETIFCHVAKGHLIRL